MRPVRPADRDRVLEISADAYDGEDYLPEVVDHWVHDPGASFQAAEVDGVVVGVQRLRPIARGIMFYEGLRVAASHRRRGLARAMLREGIREARSLGFTQMRLYTDNPDAGRLFVSEGFRLVTDCTAWTALRVEGGDPPRLGGPAEAAALAERARQSSSLAAYGGVNVDWQHPLDVDADLLEKLANQGQVRVAAGGRGMALIRAGSRRRLPVTFLAGSGAAVQDLLTALRFEADTTDVAAVEVMVPAGHPATDDLAEVGYHHAVDEGHSYIYAVEL